MRKPRRQKALDPLTPELRQLVAECFEKEMSVAEIQQLLLEHHGVAINKDPLYRFRQKEAFRLLLENRRDFQEDADALLEFAATGQASFTEAAIQLIAQKAFQLAAVSSTPEDAAQLKNYFTIIFAHRNTTVRERTAAVREGTLALRQEQHALKVRASEKKEQQEAEAAEEAKNRHNPADQNWDDPKWSEVEMERVWDLWQIPEEERVKRRAANIEIAAREKEILGDLFNPKPAEAPQP